MTPLDVLTVLWAVVFFVGCGYWALSNLFTPDYWLRYPVCKMNGHEWSDPHSKEFDDVHIRVETCERCGLDSRVHPVEPGISA